MRDTRRLIFDILLVGLAGQIGGLEPITRADSRDGLFGPQAASQTVLKVARSTDGLTFDDTGEVFLRYAAAPDLERLPSGDLLAVFDYVGAPDSDNPLRIAISRSEDGGRSWTPARPIRLKGATDRSIRIRHGDLVRVPGGPLRLYFLSDARSSGGQHRGGSNGATIVRSAVTQNGLEYRLDRRTRVRVGRGAGAHPMTAWFSKGLHLFATAVDSRAASKRDVSSARHFISPDGRRFVKLRSVQVPDVNFVGSLIATDKDIRAYVSSDRGITSLVSPDGRDWELESGLRLPDGWDPAVVQLEDSSYLMLYCAAVKDASLASSQLVDVSSYLATADDEIPLDADAAEDWAEDGTEQAPEDAAYADGADAAESDFANDADAEPSGAQSPDVASADVAQADIDAEGDALADSGTVAKDAPDGSTDAADGQESEETLTGFEDWDPIASDGFAPKPDFKTKIDYMEWYREYALSHPEDNAFWSYASFMPDTPGDPALKPEWPELNDMFNGDYDGPPKPWDPAEHPDWETSYQAAQDVLERFREATTHEGYASPPDLEVDGVMSSLKGENLLLGILLPSLSKHRAMNKATLAAAWRMEDGKVSSRRMIDAWETALRGANHIGNGATLIEDLVGIAERAQVQKTARWALKHDVFSGDELETALETLRELDRDERDPVEVLRGEHAMCMDLTQYLYMPPGANGTPQLYKPERLNKVFDFSPEMVDRIAGMGPDDVRRSIDVFDKHYREMAELARIGYPEVRAADISALTERNLQATPLTDFLLPNLSRYYHLKARSETWRRATQLTYATHLFKERNGRWPESLAELPPEHGQSMRIDPFSGDYFGYRITDDGPRIYSASENGIDDGGIHSPRWGDKIENDAGSDDYVFWPPQPKR